MPSFTFGNPPQISNESNAQIIHAYRTKKDTFLAETLAKDRESQLQRAYGLAKLALGGRFEDMREAQELFVVAGQIWAQAKIPMPTLRSDKYAAMNHRQDSGQLMAVLHRAGDYAAEEQDYPGALVWYVESLTVLENIRRSMKKYDPVYDWDGMDYDHQVYYLAISMTYNGLFQVLQKIGNTAASAFYLRSASDMLVITPRRFWDDVLTTLRDKLKSKSQSFQAMHHPEPHRFPRLRTLLDGVQLPGSWDKVSRHLSRALGSRFGSSVFAYDGYLYVCGGQRGAAGPYYFDFWRLNLRLMDQWESLPMFRNTTDDISDCGFAMNGPIAYLFMGSAVLKCFDTRNMAWFELRTTLQTDDVLKRWPYSRNFRMFSIQSVRDRIYVFGGQDAQCVAGCDLFMELDIPNKRWRRLSGKLSAVKPSFSSPGLRIGAASWVNRDQTKIFIMNGYADRVGALQQGVEHGGDRNHLYNDLWSWDITKRMWTKHKIHGNSPGPRSGMACLYNHTLDSVITFGGYSSEVQSLQETGSKELNNFSYFADTFICNMKDTPMKGDTFAARTLRTIPMNWTQVVTHGFPTYRASSHLVEDQQTGKTYLFSGFLDRQFLSGAPLTKGFTDIWELRIKLPGGNFERVDLDEEARTATQGPWQRCFSCSSVRYCKKCAGTCGGQAFFCDRRCQKAGWKEHKSRHHCRKKVFIEDPSPT